MKKSVLILGGEGFIGKNLSEFLSQKYQCFSLDLKPSIFDRSGAEFIQSDPYNDEIQDRYDVVINLIDRPLPLVDLEELEIALLLNIKKSSPKQVILFSSAAVYADPDSDYAKRKMFMEGLYKDFCDKNDINLAVVRLFNTYGPFQMPYKKGSLIANIFCGLLLNKPIEIADLSAQRDFVFSKDIAKYIDQVIASKFSGTDDLATNSLVSVGEIIGLISSKVAGKELVMTNKNTPETNTCPNANSVIIDQIKITERLVALTETFEFYKNNIKLIEASINAK